MSDETRKPGEEDAQGHEPDQGNPQGDAQSTPGGTPHHESRAREIVDQVVDKIHEVAPVVGARVQEGAEVVAKKVQEVAPVVGARVQEGTAAVAKKVQEVAPVVGEKVQEGAAKVGEMIEELRDKVSERMQQRREGGDQPGKSYGEEPPTGGAGGPEPLT